MSTPTGSLRLRQRASLSETLNTSNAAPANTNKSPNVSKRPSFANSVRSCSAGSSSLTGSQRLRLRENRAEAVFDENTPFSTIRLIMKRAASEAPNAPAPEKLFRHLMDYFGANEEEVAGVLKNQKEKCLERLHEPHAASFEDEDQTSGSYTSANSVLDNAFLSGTSTPVDVTRFSNAELMIYFNTMLGNLPRNDPDGLEEIDELARLGSCGFDMFNIIDEEKIGYVDDYGASSTEPSLTGATIKKTQNLSHMEDAGKGRGIEHLAEDTGKRLKIREEEDDDYDMVS